MSDESVRCTIEGVVATVKICRAKARNTLDMATPVPFIMGDRVVWNGSAWQSSGASGGRVDAEMFAVWDQAFSQTELQNLVVPEPATGLLLGAGLLAFALRRRR